MCEAHLCQRFKERAKRRIGVILTDTLPVEVAGFPPLVARWKWKRLRCQERSNMTDQCVSARQQHQQETWIRATGPVWRKKIILHVRFHAHALTGVKASHKNSTDGELWRYGSLKFGSCLAPKQRFPRTVAEMSDSVATTFSVQNHVRKKIKFRRKRQTS